MPAPVPTATSTTIVEEITLRMTLFLPSDPVLSTLGSDFWVRSS
jgi:hypothetical protein